MPLIILELSILFFRNCCFDLWSFTFVQTHKLANKDKLCTHLVSRYTHGVLSCHLHSDKEAMLTKFHLVCLYKPKELVRTVHNMVDQGYNLKKKGKETQLFISIL